MSITVGMRRVVRVEMGRNVDTGVGCACIRLARVACLRCGVCRGPAEGVSGAICAVTGPAEIEVSARSKQVTLY